MSMYKAMETPKNRPAKHWTKSYEFVGLFGEVLGEPQNQVDDHPTYDCAW